MTEDWKMSLCKAPLRGYSINLSWLNVNKTFEMRKVLYSYAMVIWPFSWSAFYPENYISLFDSLNILRLWCKCDLQKCKLPFFLKQKTDFIDHWILKSGNSRTQCIRMPFYSTEKGVWQRNLKQLRTLKKMNKMC